MIQKVICNRTKAAPSTADAACIAIEEATQNRFLCKDRSKYAWLPLAEYLSQWLARRCGLVVPDCFAVELDFQPGNYYFGSRWEGGAEDYSPGIIGKVTNKDEFSRIFAFDLLIHNVDRHVNNYLYLQLAGDTVVKAMDHSRSWWYSGWPLPPPPPPATSATVHNFAYWTGQAPWNKAAAMDVLGFWRSVSLQEIVDVLDSAPTSWVDAATKAGFLGWWSSPDWESRTNAIEGMLP